MNDSLRVSEIAGTCFVAVSIFLLIFPSINATTLPLPAKTAALTIALGLYGVTLGAHLYGYASVGKNNNSRVLSISAYALVVFFFLLLLSVVASVLATMRWGEESVESQLLNSVIGLLITLGALPAILFGISIIRMYQKFGFLTITAACVSPLAVIFLWEPWMPMIFVALSSYLLYRIGSQGAFHERAKIFAGR